MKFNWFNAFLTWIAEGILARAINSNVPTETTPVVVEYARLRMDLVDRLEAELGAAYVSPTTTELQAGYQLGIQAALKKLRSGYAVA